MASIIYKWSIDEWHELVDSGVLEGKPVELLEGNIVKMSPEGIEHSYTNQSVSDYLTNLLQGKAQIRDAHPITLDNSEPEPDIAVVRLPTTIYRQHHPFAQDIYLLVEISRLFSMFRNGKTTQKMFHYEDGEFSRHFVKYCEPRNWMWTIYSIITFIGFVHPGCDRTKK